MSGPPERIWLQWYGDATPEDAGFDPPAEVTHCEDKIFDYDVEYVRPEVIAKHLEARAEDFEGLPVTHMELQRLAREIRDGAHRRER